MPERQSPSTAELEAARILLSRLGLRADDLLDAPVARPTAPTFRDYIPIVPVRREPLNARCSRQKPALYRHG
jgi:hypothetical protein